MLKGRVWGNTLIELLTSAATQAAEYYGTTCVSVRLKNEGPSKAPSGDYQADYQAAVSHRLVSKPNGADFCVNCGLSSWPDSPLPVMVWPSGSTISDGVQVL